MYIPLNIKCKILKFRDARLCVLSRFSHVQLCVTSWTEARQAPPYMRFSRQEYWNGLLCPASGDFPDPGIEPGSPALRAESVLSEPLGKPSFKDVQ